MGAYCQYEMEKQRNRRVPVDTAADAAWVLVGEMVDAFDDADDDDMAVAAADDTAVADADADETAVAAAVLVGKLADDDGDKALAEELEREE